MEKRDAPEQPPNDGRNDGTTVVRALPTSVRFHELRTADELAALPPFEHRIWGGEGDAVSVNMLVAVVVEGGVAIGAFDGPTLIGSVFGFPTREPDVLHSHYLAVDPDWRRRGLGVALKHEQADWCRRNGYRAMRWTFDPLQVANAHLNLRVLGAVGITYHVNHYGTLGGINGDLPSDRLTVRWDLDGRHPARSEHRIVPVPSVTPAEIAASSAAAVDARLTLRHALAPALAQGWVVADVDREARHYVIAR